MLNPGPSKTFMEYSQAVFYPFVKSQFHMSEDLMSCGKYTLRIALRGQPGTKGEREYDGVSNPIVRVISIAI